MRRYGYCPTCHEYDELTAHKCKPKFLCAGEDWEWEPVYAEDEMQAAEKYAEECDDGSTDREEGDRVVYVRREEDQEEAARKFTVTATAEWRLNYSAHKDEAVE
jgi:hypothetical protein